MITRPTNSESGGGLAKKELAGCRYVVSFQLREIVPVKGISRIEPIQTYELLAEDSNDAVNVRNIFNYVFEHNDVHLSLRGIVRKYDMPSGLFADGYILDYDGHEFTLVSELDADI